MSEGESIFLELFRGAVKYKTYFENFIQNKDTMDVYKIALLFSDEFINLKLKDGNNLALKEISFFDIIDKLYYPEKRQTINITVNNLLQLKLDALKEFFDQNNIIKNDKKTKNKNQLINLNKKIINKYLYLLNNFYKKDEIMDLFPSLRIQEEQPIINLDRRHIIGVIINYFERKNNLISNTDYLLYAIIYIFCISMSLHSYQRMLTYLDNIIDSFGKIKFFLRQFGNIIVQTFFKYHILHKKENKYSEMGVAHIKMYYYMIITSLKQNKIVPNEEMMAVLSKFFGKLIFQERKSFHKKEEREIDNDIDFKISKNENFLCFMKHCFKHKNYIKSNRMIKSGMKDNNNSNIHIKIKENLILKPKIVIKIKDYIYSSYFFTPKKIYKLSETSFNEFNKSDNLDFGKLKIKEIRDCITNLIQYGLEMDKLIPIEFLIYTLYLLKDYEKKYKVNNKDTKINNIWNLDDDTKNGNIEEKIDNNNIEEKNDNNNIEEKKDNNSSEEKNDNNSNEGKEDNNDNNNVEEEKDNNIFEQKNDNNNNKEKNDNNIIEEKDNNSNDENNDNNNSNEEKNDNNNNEKNKDNNSNEEKNDNNNNEENKNNNSNEEKNDNNNNEENKDNNSIEENKDNNNNEEKKDSNSIEENKDNNNNEENKDNNSNEEKNDNNKNEENKDNNSNKEKNDNNNSDENNDNNNNYEEKKDNNSSDENNDNNNNSNDENNDNNNNYEEKKDTIVLINNGDNIKFEKEEDNLQINYSKKNEEVEDFTENKENEQFNNLSEEDKHEKNYLNIEEENKIITKLNYNKDINNNKDGSKDNKNEERDNDVLKDDIKIINIIKDDNNVNIINKNEENDKINDNKIEKEEISNDDRIKMEEKKNQDSQIKEEKDNIINIIEEKNYDKDKEEINEDNNKEK